jgi:hypothetical protein
MVNAADTVLSTHGFRRTGLDPQRRRTPSSGR